VCQQSSLSDSSKKWLPFRSNMKNVRESDLYMWFLHSHYWTWEQIQDNHKSALLSCDCIFFWHINCIYWRLTGTLWIYAPKQMLKKLPYGCQATNCVEKERYRVACEKEIETLEKKVAWKLVERTPMMHVPSGTLFFRCTRHPDASVRKARSCVRGDIQIEGVDICETIPQVVNWNTVRLLLILSIVSDLAKNWLITILLF